MKLKNLTGSALAIAMMSTSVAAVAAPANPASSLSVSKARIGSATTGKNKAAGAGVIAGLIAAGVVAIGVVAIVKDDNDNDSDSN
ncbi:MULTISPECIES: hypothetical protein [unclassified Sphingomonas]|jgi:hypothetical protein|uniref:hypothetical protein n=1 Tax=unclassified Sphingomonas TaxID=196159 RepID=UPI0004DFB880|nr:MULTISPECIES: hypothetical protein [unclassified Sphingomonas]KHA64377.1 hypothetical protein NI18_09435 [Sphingomonas sp. Ant20]MBD8471672.1 hypothetical protein [Sphingomonas sp. CFBP 8765]MDY1009858.1 hypothetical protein [Sphingomonas sp. CFBP9019]